VQLAPVLPDEVVELPFVVRVHGVVMVKALLSSD
jgi:hypothetical protein